MQQKDQKVTEKPNQIVAIDIQPTKNPNAIADSSGIKMAKVLVSKQTSHVRVKSFLDWVQPAGRSKSCCQKRQPESPFLMFEEFDKNGHRIFHRAASVYSKKIIKEAMDCFEDHVEELEHQQFDLKAAVMEMSGILATDQSEKDFITFNTLKGLMEETPNSHGVTPLWLAFVSKPAGQEEERKEFIKYLIENIGVKVDVIHSETLWTPVHWAARHGDYELLKLLLDKEAKAFTPDIKGRFPIDLAGYFEHHFSVKLIIEHSIRQYKLLLNKSQKQQSGKLLEEPQAALGILESNDAFLVSPYYASVLLFWAVQCELTDKDEVQFILETMESYPETRMPFEQQRTAIHAAASCDYPEKLDMLCTDLYKRHQIKTKEALVDRKNLIIKRKENKLESILQLHDIALKQPQLAELKELEKNFWSDFKLVHSQVLDFDLQDLDGNTPLHLAAQYNNTRSAKTLLENWRCSCDVRNWRGVMSKNMGLWHKETQKLFQEYYYIVDNKLKLQEQHKSLKGDIEQQKISSKQNTNQITSQIDVAKVEAIQDWKEDTVSTMQRIISQKDAEIVLTPGLLKDRTEMPQCPDVVMLMTSKSPEQKRRLNFVLRMLDANSFSVRIFKGVSNNKYFVTLTLSEAELVKEAVMCGYLVKVQQYSIKVPFSEKLQNKLVPFTSKDIQVLTMKKLQRVFNFQDLYDQKILESVFSMHDDVELFHVEESFSKKGWSKYVPHIISKASHFIVERFTGEQSYKELSAMASYFGEKRTLISSFFIFYSIWMVPIVLFAAGISIYQYSNKIQIHTCGPQEANSNVSQLYYKGDCPSANITSNITDLITNDTLVQNVTSLVEDYISVDQVTQKTVEVVNQSRNILAIFGLFVSIYATIMIEFWKRKQNHIHFVLGRPITEDEETVMNPDFLGYKKMSWSKFDVTRSEKNSRRCKSWTAKIFLFIVAIILLSASVAGYVVVRNRITNGTVQGVLTAVILSVTSFIHNKCVRILLKQANMKYLNDRNRAYIINKMAFEFINLNLPIVYALTTRDSRQQNIESGFVYDQTYHLIFGIVFSTCLSIFVGDYFVMFLRYQIYKFIYFVQVRLKAAKQIKNYTQVQPDDVLKMTEKAQKDIYSGCFQPETISSQEQNNNSTSELININQNLSDSTNLSHKTKQRRCCGKFTWETTLLRPVVRSGQAKKNSYESDFKLFIDEVELNSRMVVFEEKDQILITIQKYLVFSLSILYAGICPISTIVCFGFFLFDPIIERFLMCYVWQRETPLIDTPSEIWTQYAEMIVIANVISNNFLLFVATESYQTILYEWFGLRNVNIIWYVLLFEHIIIFIQVGIKYGIPDMPIALKKLLMRHVLELEHFYDIKSSEKPTAKEKAKAVQEISQKQKALEIINYYQKDKVEIGIREGRLADFLQVDPRQHNYKNIVEALENGLRVNLEIRMYRETFLLVERAILTRKMKKFQNINSQMIIACVECSSKAANFFCQECGDHFCFECNDFLHKNNSVYQKHTRQTIQQPKLPIISNTSSFPPVKGQSASWRKFEYFNFPLNPQNQGLFKQIQTYFEYMKRVYLRLNYIDEITGRLDIPSMLVDQNYDSLEREMGRKILKQHLNQLGDRSVMSQKELINFEYFNEEELFYLNRVSFRLLKKVGANLKFDLFVKDLDTLQNGSYHQRIHLWLSSICETEEQIRLTEVDDINLKQDLISIQKFTQVVSASFPQHPNQQQTIDSVILSIYGKQELLSISDLEQKIKTNSAAQQLICCIIQIDPSEVLAVSTTHSATSFGAD